MRGTTQDALGDGLERACVSAPGVAVPPEVHGQTAVLEADLARPVADWLRGRGYVVHAEVPYAGRCIDLVGLHADGRVAVVELKLTMSVALATQIRGMWHAADELVVAVRSEPRRTTRVWRWLEKNGVGVLRVTDGGVVEIRASVRPETRGGHTFPGAVTALRRMCAAVGEGDEAGVPTRKGVGPAQAVCDEVERLRASEPSVGWREIFDRVPNHYASWQSMRSAIGRVLEQRGREVA